MTLVAVAISRVGASSHGCATLETVVRAGDVSAVIGSLTSSDKLLVTAALAAAALADARLEGLVLR